MDKKIKKGMYGYRDAHKKRQILLVSLFLLVIAALLVSRYFITWKSLKNLVTISAILTDAFPWPEPWRLPLMASWKTGPPPESFYDACRPYGEKFPILYDLIITSRDFIMPVDVAVIHPTGVYLYCPKKGIDTKAAEKFLNEMLTGWKLDGNARIMTEKKNFLTRLSTLKNVTEDEDDGSAPHVEKLLKSLSM